MTVYVRVSCLQAQNLDKNWRIVVLKPAASIPRSSAGATMQALVLLQLSSAACNLACEMMEFLASDDFNVNKK